MRGKDPTSGQAPRGAWRWLILAATVATIAPPAAVRAQSGPTGAGAGAGRAADPIELAARSIRVWDDGEAQWIVLQGRVAIAQGLDGLRADQAVVRVTSSVAGDARTFRAEVYAEGQVQAIGPAQPARPNARATLSTEGDVRLQPYKAGGVARVSGPPRDAPVVARGFPQARAAITTAVPTQPQRTSTAPVAPTPAPAPAPAPVANPAPDPVPIPVAAAPASRPRFDRSLMPAQFDQEGFADGPPVELTPAAELPTTAGPEMPDLTPGPAAAAPDLGGLPPALEAPALGSPGAPPLPLPATAPPSGAAPSAPGPPGPAPPMIPIAPGTQRFTRIFARDGGAGFLTQTLPTVDGLETIVIRGGVNIVVEGPVYGIIDITADSAIVWRQLDARKATLKGPDGATIDDAGQPMEVYLEGNVIVRQDEKKIAGNADQKTYRAKQAYYDLRTGRFVGLEAELDMFAPGLIAPTKVFSPRIDQFRPIEQAPDGRSILGREHIQADQTLMTGSRFPVPGYKFTSRYMDITKVVSTKTNPNSGKTAGNPRDPKAPQESTWHFEASRNIFFLGPVPSFYWPRISGDADDLEPPLRSMIFSTNNYFGQQFLTDYNGFRITGIEKPRTVDQWNFDLDYLSKRTKTFPALGMELAWFGKDYLNDLLDPYGRNKGAAPSFARDHFGYFDIWGLDDHGIDVLGAGPAVVTGSKAIEEKYGRKGYQRGASGIPGLPKGVPPFQQFRGRVNYREMISFLPDEEAYRLDDFRLQVEGAYVSDRHFLEEYYKRLFETGLDQETLAFGIYQRQNWAASLLTEVNLQPWYTDTQWLPRLDYYRLGDSLLGDRLTYFGHSGVDYGNTHTAVEVNNKYIFAFMPYDPISNTSRVLSTGRAYTNHELDLPFNIDNVVRFVPYVQGQAVGWNNQIGGNAVGRLWGAAGVRADFMMYRAFPGVESGLFNVHGLNHKVTFEADYRDAYSNVQLDRIGVQDDLDDNTYEFVRRYLALTNYKNGILPPQYDPRHLILRRAISPITGTTDVQASMNTLQLNLHSRLQTRRGPEGRRRVIDYMTLDASTTYFPQATRDNFGKSFGQNMYNWQWFLGDRTSIISYGWFETFKIGGFPTYQQNVAHNNNPFGLNVITSGIMLTRPPRGNIFIGYTVIDTGPLTTSALNFSNSYWLSPKWFGTFATSYDFGNHILLAEAFSLTRIGADYLTSVGLTVDPQRQSYQFALQISPRASPNIRLGSGQGSNSFDSRYAPTQ